MSFKEFRFFTKLTSVANSAFQSCTGLTYVEIPTNITTLGSFAFQDANVADVVLPASVSSIGDSCFRSNNSGRKWLKTLTMYRVTPPSLANTNAFLNQTNAKFYVPSASVDAYKTASVWSNFASRFYAIEE